MAHTLARQAVDRAAARIRDGEAAGLVIDTEAERLGIPTTTLSAALRDRKKASRKRYTQTVPAYILKGKDWE